MMKIVIEILKGTPWWVFILFAYLLYKGFKASKPHSASLKKLLIIPLAFFCYSTFNVISKSQIHHLLLIPWIATLLTGFFLGKLFARSLSIEFDKETKEAKMPGSYLILILALSIFAMKYTLNVCYAIFPALQSNIFLIASEITLSGIFSGTLLGKLFIIFTKYREITSQSFESRS